MYSTRGGLVLGFHGCDASVLEAVISGGAMLRESKNTYDWLGHGIYFWENSPSRALAFAEELQRRSNNLQGKIQKPSVIGAIIDLGYCLDLFDFENLSFLKEAYQLLQASNPELPSNRAVLDSGDLLLRDLDCAVVETLHAFRAQVEERPFDSVRGAFQEGKELYPNAGFREKTIFILRSGLNCSQHIGDQYFGVVFVFCRVHIPAFSWNCCFFLGRACPAPTVGCLISID